MSDIMIWLNLPLWQWELLRFAMWHRDYGNIFRLHTDFLTLPKHQQQSQSWLTRDRPLGMEWFLHCAVSCVWNQFSYCTSRFPESCWFSQTQAKPYWNPWGFDESTDLDSFLLECTVQFEKLLKTHETTKSGNKGIGIRRIQFNQLKFSDAFIRCLNWNLKVQHFSFFP